MRHGRLLAGLLAGGVLSTTVVLPPAAGAGEREPSGKTLYLRYCGACHGPEAKGDGIVATFMRPKPPDLTVIARDHGGEFPLEDVVRTIDGREAPRAHGDPTMPVWGRVLTEEIGGTKGGLPVERRVRGRILSIAEHLQQIQVK
jgi:mono/diheme cytochrome c family protein